MKVLHWSCSSRSVESFLHHHRRTTMPYKPSEFRSSAITEDKRNNGSWGITRRKQNHFLKRNRTTDKPPPWAKHKIERTNSMYKFRTGWEKDHERWEEVDEQEQCDGCNELNRHCRCTETADEAPVEKSFHERNGFDERDGPPEEDEEYRYVNDPSEPPVGNRRIW